MKKIFISLLIVFLISCNSRKNNTTENENLRRKVGISVTKNDSIISKYESKLERKFEIYGAKDNALKILSDSNTVKKIKGKFSFGIREKNNHKNKMMSFLEKEDLKFPDLEKTDLIKVFSLEKEYLSNIDGKNLKTFISNFDTWRKGNVEYNTITFSFLNKDKDTVGFQHSQFTVTKSSIVSIHYLYEKKEDFKEMNSSINKIVLKYKK